MCGICGIINRDPDCHIVESDIKRMNDQIIHRGPDADGIYLNKNIAFGHRRLKIIDLEGGIQPMFNNEKTVTIVFNGEIYNFREIRKELTEKGYIFRTESDTEVIIHAYTEYGENCVQYFRGMFAIAIYDSRLNKILLIRDRIGIKPVYYYLDEHILVFSSEIKPILKTIKNDTSVHLPSLDFYMSVGYVPGENTLFSDIKKLEAGHILTLQNNKINIRQYWNLSDTPCSNVSFEQSLQEFDELFKESVKMRMISDVPLGAFLSGGLDSSAIVSAMSRISQSKVKTFSVGYKNEPESNELGYAKIVADYFNTEHHEYILEPISFFDSLDVLLNYTEEPIVESAAIALYQLSKLAKEHVTVILSGEGGDEILAGYPLHQITSKIEKLHTMSKFIPQFIKNRIESSLNRSEKAMKYWDWINLPVSERYQSISNDVTFSIKEKFYQSDVFLDNHKDTVNYYKNLYAQMSQGTRLRKMTYSDIKSWLPDDLLVKADKMTMAASLELRVPLLDHKLLEYATALPDNFRLRGSQGKFLLKKLMEQYLPQKIIYRKKKGFPVPIASWFRTTLFDKTKEILLDPVSINRGYFKKSYIESILIKHKQGTEDHSRRIFSLLNLELWHRKYID